MKELVQVKPIINKNKWHGLHNLNRSRFQNTAVTVQAFYDESLGMKNTGLTPEEVKRYGKLLNVSLEPNSDFWDDFKVKLKDGTNIFNIARPTDYIAVKLLKAWNGCANSLIEYNQNKWPSAQWYISNDKEEAEKKAAVTRTKSQAYKILSDLSPAQHKKLIKLYGKVKPNITVDEAYSSLGNEIETDPNFFISLTKQDQKTIDAKALIHDAYRLNILRKRNLAYLYVDSQIGYDLADTVEYLLHPDNKDLYQTIKEQVEAKLQQST